MLTARSKLPSFFIVKRLLAHSSAGKNPNRLNSNRIFENFFTKEKTKLEIERKFWYSFDIETRLTGLGGKKLDHNELTDEYVDNLDSYFLLFNDYLLRSRKSGGGLNKWQLKYPSGVHNGPTVENYLELTQPAEIIKAISGLNQLSGDLKSIQELIDACNLKCFARINSCRRSYLIDGLRVDLDETDFGYKLGEIELVLDQNTADSNEYNNSMRKISRLTEKLGKVSAYLYLFNRPLFHALVNNSIVSQNVYSNLSRFFKE